MKFASYTLVALVLTGSSVAFAHGHRGADGGRAHLEQVDLNKDGKISLEESRKAAEERFSKLDTNKDGVVTQAEVAAMKETHRAQFKAKAAERFAEKDANKDGKLSATEVPHMPEAWFKQLDANKDGALSQEEFLSRGPGRHAGRDGKGQAGHGPEGLLQKLDANKDGQLSKAEAQTAADEHFRRMDRNADGYIAQDEQRHGFGRGGHGRKEHNPEAQQAAPKK